MISQKKRCFYQIAHNIKPLEENPILPKLDSRLAHYQQCSGKYPATVSLVREKPLIGSVCQFLWCKYPTVAIFKLSMWHHWIQSWNWENLGITASCKPLFITKGCSLWVSLMPSWLVLIHSCCSESYITTSHSPWEFQSFSSWIKSLSAFSHYKVLKPAHKFFNLLPIDKCGLYPLCLKLDQLSWNQ